MIFWVGILFGGLFAYVAVKQGFYETWVLLFNAAISIYLAIFLYPVVSKFIPAAGEMKYGDALTMLSIGVGSFLILYGISYVFFSSQFNVSLPKMLDVVGSGLVGFLTGFLIWSFIVLLVSLTPLSENSMLESAGFTKEAQQANIAYMNWWTNKVNTMVSYKSSNLTSEDVIEQIHEQIAEKEAKKKLREPKPIDPNDTPNINEDETQPSGGSERLDPNYSRIYSWTCPVLKVRPANTMSGSNS